MAYVLRFEFVEKFLGKKARFAETVDAAVAASTWLPIPTAS